MAVSTRVVLANLREMAERCLREEAPTASQARELAASVLASLAHLDAQQDEAARAPAREEHPYRSPSPGDPGDHIPEIVALERALEEVRDRLAAAEAALAARKT